MFRDKKRNKTEEEHDKVLRTAVIVVILLLIIGGVIVAIRLANPRADIEEGAKKLEQLSKRDVSKIDARIQELEKAEKAADEEWQNRSLNEKFANSLVLGDSISQGIYEFGLMDQAFVIATKGAEVTRAEDSGSLNNLKKAAEAKPQNIFFAYGADDLVSAGGDETVFAEKYKAFLDEAKALMPDTAIYVNSVLPVNQTAIDKNASYGKVAQFNKALEKLCEEQAVIFIDQTEAVKEEYYTEDGVHMNPDFYQGWLERMVEAAEL